MNRAAIILQVICAVLTSMLLSYLSASGRRCKSTNIYMFCTGLLLFWNVAEILLLMSENGKDKIIIFKIKFIPVVYAGVSWLYFCLTATCHKIAENRLFKFTLIVFPAACYAFLLTNEHHRMFYKGIMFKTRLAGGPVFWIHTVESYFCLISGTVILLNKFKIMEKSADKKVLFALVLLIPLTADILMLTDAAPGKGLIMSVQVFLIVLIIAGIIVYRKKFLYLTPAAAGSFIENMPDGIVIIDSRNIIVGMNNAINEMLPGLKLKIYDSAVKLSDYIRNRSFGEIRDRLADAIESEGDFYPVKGNLKIDGLNIYVEAGILKNFNRACRGRIVIFEDQSEEYKLMNEIKNKNLLLTIVNERLIYVNKMLKEANYRLEQYSRTAEELAASKERNRMSREVHDTVGHTLTLLIALSENIKSKLNDDQEELKKMLDKNIDISRQALNDIRNYLKGLCSDSVKNTNLAEWLKDLANDHAVSGVDIEVSIDENIPDLDASRTMTVYRVCQEAVTNAIRHGEAKTVNIIIKRHSDGIKLYIIDDGKGCKNIVKGYGITGMEERISKLGGTVSFGSDGEKGFSVIAFLPV